jgi:transposase
MNITRIGVDLAKNVFQLHGVNRQGEIVVKKQLRRTQMLDWFGKLAPCLIGMEACGSPRRAQ